MSPLECVFLLEGQAPWAMSVAGVHEHRRFGSLSALQRASLAGQGPLVPEQQRTIWRGVEGALPSLCGTPAGFCPALCGGSYSAFALWILHPPVSLLQRSERPKSTSLLISLSLVTPAAALLTVAWLARAPRRTARPAPRGCSGVPPPGSPQRARRPRSQELSSPPQPIRPPSAGALSFLCVHASRVGAEGEGGGRSVGLSPPPLPGLLRVRPRRRGPGRARGQPAGQLRAGGRPGPPRAGSAERSGAGRERRSTGAGRPPPPALTPTPTPERSAKARRGTETTNK